MSTISKGGTNTSTTVSKLTAKKTKKKSVQEHKAAGAKAVGSTLKFLGQNIMAANRNRQVMQLSKMVTPD